MAPLAEADRESLDGRVSAALAAAEKRHAAYLAGLSRREELLALVQQAEELGGQELGAARAAFPALDAKWREATAGADLPDLRSRFEAVAATLRSRGRAARDEQAQKDQQHLDQLVRLADRAEALVARGSEVSLRDADHALREIREALEHPGHFPTRKDREAALARLDAARKHLYPLLQQLREDAEWKRWVNTTVQEELCAKAEALLAEEDLERAANTLRELDARWKQAKEAPKDQAEALWTRFKAARDQVKSRTDAFFAKQAEELAGNLKKKEALCEKAEALAESTDWLKTAEELRKLQAEWKEIGPVPRTVSQRVWERFRKPCDHFFTRWQEHRNLRSHEWADNLAKKEALCEKAEALRESTDWEAGSAELKRLQAEWRTIGAVKKSRSEAIWQRFRAACDHFFDRYKNRDEHARQAAQDARETHLRGARGAPPRGGRDAPSRPPTSWRGCRRRRRRGVRRAACPRTRWPRSTSASPGCATGSSSSSPAPSRAATSTPRRAAARPRSSSSASRACSRSSSRAAGRRRPRTRRSSPRACATRSPPTRSAAARRSRPSGTRPRSRSRRRRRPGSASARCRGRRAATSRPASSRPAAASSSSGRSRSRTGAAARRRVAAGRRAGPSPALRPARPALAGGSRAGASGGPGRRPRALRPRARSLVRRRVDPRHVPQRARPRPLPAAGRRGRRALAAHHPRPRAHARRPRGPGAVQRSRPGRSCASSGGTSSRCSSPATCGASTTPPARFASTARSTSSSPRCSTGWRTSRGSSPSTPRAASSSPRPPSTSSATPSPPSPRTRSRAAGAGCASWPSSRSRGGGAPRREDRDDRPAQGVPRARGRRPRHDRGPGEGDRGPPAAPPRRGRRRRPALRRPRRLRRAGARGLAPPRGRSGPAAAPRLRGAPPDRVRARAAPRVPERVRDRARRPRGVEPRRGARARRRRASPPWSRTSTRSRTRRRPPSPASSTPSSRPGAPSATPRARRASRWAASTGPRARLGRAGRLRPRPARAAAVRRALLGPVLLALALRLVAVLATDRVVADVERYQRVAGHLLDVSWNPYETKRLYPYPPPWAAVEAAAEWLARRGVGSFPRERQAPRARRRPAAGRCSSPRPPAPGAPRRSRRGSTPSTP